MTRTPIEIAAMIERLKLFARIEDGGGSCDLQFQTSPSREAAAMPAAFEMAAEVASWAHMVPPDGGSPSEAECLVAKNAAAAIRELGEKWK